MDNTHLTITVFSHHFTVTNMTPRGRNLCNQFSSRFVQYGFISQHGRYIRQALKVFAARTEDKMEFRFHINSLDDFFQFLKSNYIDEKLYHFIEAPDYIAEKIDVKVKSQFTPRDYQIPIIDYLISKVKNLTKRFFSPAKLVGIQTGKGKGKTSMMAMERIEERIAIVIAPMYIQKWIEELLETYDNLTFEDIIVVEGAKSLMALLQFAKEDKLTAKVIIISDATYRNWLKTYERFRYETLEIGYASLPETFYQDIKAGVRLIDELHKSFHFFFKCDLYTHVRHSISLSATLISDNPFLTKMYEIMHPLETRSKGMDIDKYAHSFAIHYRFNNPGKIRTMEYGSKNYSHNAFEESVMRHVPTLNNYLSLIEYTVSISYLNVTREKKRCLIFAYTKEICTKIVNHLKTKFPQYDIRRYVGEDPWENLMEADITVSTLGSAGTAVDIPDLTTVILTTAISSIQSNVQSFGRLRRLHDDYPVEFLYFCCDDLDKHVEYHNSKKQMLAQRAKTFKDIYSGKVL